MVSRGVHQLKNIRLYFCDVGGSSKGIRQTMQSQQLVDFVNANEHLKFEFYMRRSHHPYMSATYINGYIKDIPLKNLSLDETLSKISLINK